MHRIRRDARQPLARWGFTAVAVFSLGTGQITAGLIVAALAGLCWHQHTGGHR